MKKYVILTPGALFALPLLLAAINIAQNGSSTPDGRTPDEILGVAAKSADVEDVVELSKADIMQLFYALRPPAPGELDGEYRAVLLNVGVLSGGSAWFTHNLFGDGRWLGKGFRAKIDASEDSRTGGGYNLFAGTRSDATGSPQDRETIVRLREFNTFTGASLIDSGESFHLDYSAHNGGTVHSMRDEIRKINERLYIGMGHMTLGGGPINPAPFLLIGPARGPARATVDDIN